MNQMPLLDNGGRPTTQAMDREPSTTRQKTLVCQCCGQKIRKLNPHRMDRQKVAVLHAISRLNAVGYEWVNALEGGMLVVYDGQQTRKVKTTYCSRNHAERLHWFGLLDYAGRRSGEYRVNQQGLNFLSGRASVPARIWCRGGTVIERDSKVVRLSEISGVTLTKQYWDHYADAQQYDPPPLESISYKLQLDE